MEGLTIDFPPLPLPQGREYFVLRCDGQTRNVSLHDYDAIFAIPGLYEEVFRERLRCESGEVVSRAISFISAYKGMSIGSFRLLEIGAGNGVVGQELRRVGVGHLIGLDVSNIACEAAWRDRSTVYDDYIVADLDCLNEDMDRWLRKKIFNGLVAVASLGFADVAASAFRRALSFIQPKAFVAVTIKEDFLRGDDRTGFSQVFGDLRQNGFKQVFWERHIHRFSTSNEPIYYITLVLTNLT